MNRGIEKLLKRLRESVSVYEKLSAAGKLEDFASARDTQIYPPAGLRFFDCEGKEIGSWPPPVPPVIIPDDEWSTISDSEIRKRKCSAILKHYNEMRKKLDVCFGNCRSDSFDFAQCLSPAGPGAVSAMDPMMPSAIDAPPAGGPPTQTPTERRNCELRRKRCHCAFERKRFELMLEMKKLAELYWGECAPFIRRKCDTDEACQKEENRLKELWAKECKKLKEKIFPNEEKCAKDQRGRFVYTECKDMCEKCLGGMQ